MGVTGGIGTDWKPYDRSRLDVPLELLQSIMDRTADAWLVLEPVPPAAEKSGWRKKQAKSDCSVTVSPFADEVPAHLLVFGTFPKGPAFTERGVALPPWATLVDSSRDDVNAEVPLGMPLDQVIAFAMALLDGCSDHPLGDQWQAALGDTYVYNNLNN